MKQKLLITEEEKIKILTSHIKAGYRTNILEFILNEEDTFGSQNITPEQIMESYNYLINLYKNNYDFYKEFFDKSLRYGLLGPWLILMNTLGKDNGNTTETKKPLDVETIKKYQEKYIQLYYLSVCIQTYEKRADRKEIFKILVKKTGETIEQTEIPKITNQPTTFPPEDLPIRLDGNRFNLFEDNKSDPTAELITYLENEIKTKLSTFLKETLDENPEYKKEYEKDPSQFNWECTDIFVQASASRFSNTGEASGMNFITLSKLRAEKGYAKIIEILTSNGVVFGDTFKLTEQTGRIAYKGDNGDGTNGPVVPKGNRVAVISKEGIEGGKPEYLNSGTPEYDSEYKKSEVKYTAAPTAEKLKEVQKEAKDKGEKIPTDIKSLYDQYKTFGMECSIRLIFTDKLTGEEPSKPDIQETKYPQFTIFFIKKQEGGGTGKGRKRPPIKKRKRNNKPRPGAGGVRCPKFGTKGFWSVKGFFN